MDCIEFVVSFEALNLFSLSIHASFHCIVLYCFFFFYDVLDSCVRDYDNFRLKYLNVYKEKLFLIL